MVIMVVRYILLASNERTGTQPPLTIAQLRTRGETATANLSKAITRNTPDKNAAVFEEVYRVKSIQGARATPDLRVVLRPLNKNSRSNTYTEYSVINKDQSDPDTPILQLKVSGIQGTIINEVSYLKKDTLPIDEKIRWSDQAFQSWQREGGNPRLNLVIQRNIQNDATNKAITQFHAAHCIGKNVPGIWLPGSDEYNALMGSDNGRPVAYMLQDHHRALGDRKVTSITTYAQSSIRTRSLMGLIIG